VRRADGRAVEPFGLMFAVPMRRRPHTLTLQPRDDGTLGLAEKTT